MTGIDGMHTDILAERLDWKMTTLQNKELGTNRKEAIAPEAVHIAFELRCRGDLDEDKFEGIINICNEYIHA